MNKRSAKNATPFLSLHSLREYCSRMGVGLAAEPAKSSAGRYVARNSRKSQSTNCLAGKHKTTQQSNYQLRVGKTRQELISITAAKIYMPPDKIPTLKGHSIRSLHASYKPRCHTEAGDWLSPRHSATPHTLSFFEEQLRNTISHPRRPRQCVARPSTANHFAADLKSSQNRLKSIQVYLPTRQQSERREPDHPIAGWETDHHLQEFP